jgi:hypothetical protein
MVDYLNQPLPSIQQPYRPGYDKNYGPGKGMGYAAVMPKPGYQYVYGPDGQRYSIPIPGYIIQMKLQVYQVWMNQCTTVVVMVLVHMI